MNQFKKHLLGCVVFVFAFAMVGCETLMIDADGKKRKKKEASWFSFKKKEYKNPQSMTATWAHDILTLAGKAPTRGFGGRFYFYDETNKAIPVEGDLVVYGFDDTHKQKQSDDLNQATKRFRFTAEQLSTHYTEGELGASYSVWIPWDEAYGPAKKVMLIPTFLMKDGKLVRGTAANLSLPGSGEDPNESVIRQTSATIPSATKSQMIDLQSAAALTPISGLRTTTIQVPSSSLMRGLNPSEPTASMSAMQSQENPSTEIIQANYMPNASSAMAISAMDGVQAQNQSLSAHPASQRNATFGPPKSMSVPKLSTNTVNGWVRPEYSPMDVSKLAPRSEPNQFQVQASQGVPPSSYPIR